MDRLGASRVAHVSAECCDCSWSSAARNALGNAARHHDATGHYVTWEQVIAGSYGDNRPEAHGQTTIEDTLGEVAA